MKQLFKISLIAFLFVFIIPNVSFAREPLDGGSTPGGTVTYTISTNKSTYTTAELIDITISSIIGVCFNNYRYSFTGGIYNSSNVLQSGTAISGEGDVGDGIPMYSYVTGYPPSTAGDYTLKLTIKTYTDWTGNVFTTSTVSKGITFTEAIATPPPVVTPPVALSINVVAQKVNLPTVGPSNPLNLNTKENTIDILVKPTKTVTSCTWSGGGKSGTYSNTIDATTWGTIGTVSGVDLTTTFDVSCSDDVVSTPPKTCTLEDYTLHCDDSNWGMWGNCNSNATYQTNNFTNLSNCLSWVEKYCWYGNVSNNSFNDGTTASCEAKFSEPNSSGEINVNFISFN